jgi:hypothetical protein
LLWTWKKALAFSIFFKPWGTHSRSIPRVYFHYWISMNMVNGKTDNIYVNQARVRLWSHRLRWRLPCNVRLVASCVVWIK